MGVVITITGAPGSGKSTIGRMLATRLNIPFYSMGDIRRKYATERGMTLAELNKAAETDPTSDRLVDEYQAALPQHVHSFVLDGRMGFHFLPKSIKIYITVDRRAAAQRIFNQRRDEENWHSIEDGIVALQHREESDKRRYWNLYHVDPTKLSQYDIVIDSTEKNPLELMDEILAIIHVRGFFEKPETL